MHRSEREEMQERPTGYLFSKSAWSGLSKSICKREVGSGQSRICINGAIDDGHAVGSGQSRICIDGVIDGYPVELVPQPFGHHWWEWKTYEDKKDKGHEFQGGTLRESHQRWWWNFCSGSVVEYVKLCWQISKRILDLDTYLFVNDSYSQRWCASSAYKVFAGNSIQGMLIHAQMWLIVTLS